MRRFVGFEANIASGGHEEICIETSVFVVKCTGNIRRSETLIIIISLFGELLQILRKRLVMIKVDADIPTRNQRRER